LLRILRHVFSRRPFGSDCLCLGREKIENEKRRDGRTDSALVGIRFQRLFTRGERPPSGDIISQCRTWKSEDRWRGPLCQSLAPAGLASRCRSDSRPPKASPRMFLMLSIQVRGCRLWIPVLRQPGSTPGVGFELKMPRCAPSRAGTRQRSPLHSRQVGQPAANLVGIAGKVPASRIRQSRRARNSESWQHLESAVSRAPYLMTAQLLQ
jgi:hypothetical protein